MNTLERIARHLRIARKAFQKAPSPPFLILFINSICNLKCEHCFDWSSLNKKDDLTFEETRHALGRSWTDREPEPLRRRTVPAPRLRRGLPAVHQAERREADLRAEQRLLHGTDDRADSAHPGGPQSWSCSCSSCRSTACPQFHDEFRGTRSFPKAMETYDALAELQARDPRLRIHCDLDGHRGEHRRDPAAHHLSLTSAARRWITTTWP